MCGSHRFLIAEVPCCFYSLVLRISELAINVAFVWILFVAFYALTIIPVPFMARNIGFLHVPNDFSKVVA